MIFLAIEENAGIGNQMFQYAHAYALAHRYNQKITIVSYIARVDQVREYMLDKMMIDDSVVRYTVRNDITNIFKKDSKFRYKNALNRIYRQVLSVFFHILCKIGVLSPIICSKDANREYISDPIMSSRKSYYIEGFYETYKYFDDVRDAIRRQLRVKEELLTNNDKKLINEIANNESVAVHIRQGDFSVCGRAFPIEYYDSVMRIVAEEILGAVFYVLSEDKSVFQHYYRSSNIRFIKSSNHRNRDLIEWYILSQCKYHIVTNSTFSWWAAYASTYKDKKVFVPDKDIYMFQENADIYLSGKKYEETHYYNFYPSDWIVVKV